jgi:broad specificity phosphatase PhoE
MPGSGEDTSRYLILMRHGETSWNRELRIMGDADVPLSDAGRRQCRAVARVLTGFAIDRIVSSPLVRAVESAEILSDALGLGLSRDADLAEVRFGRWQGKTYDEILRDPDYAAYRDNPLEHPTPGGETLVDVQRRGLSAFGRLRPGERVLFVSHGDIIRAATCHYLELPLGEYRRVRIDNCGLTAIAERDGHTEVKFVNALADPVRAWDPLHWSRAT